MRHRFWLGLALSACVALAGCNQPPGAEDEPHSEPTLHIDHGEDDETGGAIYVYLNLAAAGGEIDQLTKAVLEVEPGADATFTPATSEFTIAPGRESEVSACVDFEGPLLEIRYGTDDGVGHAILDVVETFDIVIRIDAWSLGVEHDPEALYIACGPKIVNVLVDPEADVDLAGLRNHALTIPGVIGASSNAETDTTGFHTPDLSSYPEVAVCYQPIFETVTVYLESDDPALTDEVVASFGGQQGVSGFGGWNVDESLDPVMQWEQALFEGNDDLYRERCEGIEAYVELDGGMTDAEAAVIVARAKTVEGVADVDLRLVDQSEYAECESVNEGPLMVSAIYFLSTEEIDPCFIPSSQLTIYRGDKSLATPQALADALCDLPGVVSIQAYDREGDAEPDPYVTCGALRLTVVLGDASEGATTELISRLAEFDGVARVEGPFVGHDIKETVVVGNLDELACFDPGNHVTLTLKRMAREDAEALASEIAALDSVLGVTGSAIGVSQSDPAICGFEGIYLELSQGITKSQMDALWDLLRASSEVHAVILRQSEEGEESYLWATVHFATDYLWPYAQDLATSLESMPGVSGVEVWD